MPKISVIVPVYKVEAYLNKCVDSILAQTFTDFELILVDDGSPDKCGEICDAYAKQDNRIKVIHKENGGLSDARNAGIEIACGEQLMFVDSDDYIDVKMLEIMEERMRASDADLVACSVRCIDEKENVLEDPSHMWMHIEDGIYEGSSCMQLLNDGMVMAWAKLYKKDLFAKLRFPVGKLHEDEFVAHHIIGACEKIVKVAKPMYYYLQRSGSIMNTNYGARNLDSIEAYMDRISYCLAHDQKALAVRTAHIIVYTLELARKRLDFSNKENKRRFKKIKKEFAELYKKKLQKRVSLKTNLNMILFLYCPQVRSLVLGQHKKLFAPLRGVLRRVRSRKFEKVFRAQVQEKRKNGICVFLMATPCHGNLGDHAIVYAEKKLLEQCGYADNIVEISNDTYRKYWYCIKKYVKTDDIIVIDGGGNLGALWPLEDDKIGEIISTYKKNKIIVFPQTCYYDDSAAAKERLKKNRKIYASAEQLLIALRDKKSYDFCVENFKGVNFVYTPDIVLSLAYDADVERQDKCLICFRADCEKVLSDADERKISEFLKENGMKIETVSTVCDYPVSAQMRDVELEKLWNTISEAKLLLTDRLHGMIFAAITGTPCLALDNKSKKVSGVYKWIEKLSTVQVCSSAEEMLEKLSAFYALDANKYDAMALDAAFVPLKEFLNKN